MLCLYYINLYYHVLFAMLDSLKVDYFVQIMGVKFPRGICLKSVGVKHKAICCDLCNKLIHIASNNLDKKT